MKNPSPQFIGKLENELRLAYRAQYAPQQSPARKPLRNFFKFFIPALSGALVLGMVLLNFGGNIFSGNIKPQAQDNQQTSAENRLVTFNDGADEEQLAKDFDNDELTQIDNNVRLVTLSNF